MAVLGKTWVDLIDRGIEPPIIGQLRSQGGAPLADRPGEPVGGNVARNGAAEGEVLKLAGEREHIAAHRQPPDFEQQAFIEQRLLVIHLHQAGDAAVAVDLLGSQQRTGVGLLSQALAVAVAQGQAKRRALPAQQALQVEARIGHQLIAVSALVLLAALGVVGQLIDIGELQVHALLMQEGALALPVAEEKIGRRIAIGLGQGQGARAQ
ncbi:hypothetical protein D9M71_458830 [compost metagenome]